MSEEQQQQQLNKLARTLRIKPDSIAYLNKLASDDIESLRVEMHSALTSQHNAFKQSLRHASDQLPRLFRRSVQKRFQK